MIGAANDLARVLLDVLRGVPGVRPASPASRPEATWVPWDLDALAVDIDDDLVQIRVVALELPLVPILRSAETALRSALDESSWRNALLRLVVTDIDAAAFGGKPGDPGAPAQRDRGHTIRP